VLAPWPQAFATLPLALAVARLGCLVGGCCHGPAGEPTVGVARGRRPAPGALDHPGGPRRVRVRSAGYRAAAGDSPTGRPADSGQRNRRCVGGGASAR
jgi:hypothetical protein